MNLKQHLQQLSTKSEAQTLFKAIMTKPALLHELIHVYLEGTTRQTQRAAGVLRLCAEKTPELVIPHLPAMLLKLKEAGVPDAAKRNTVRILQFLEIPEELEEEVMELCFNYLESGKEAVAIKAFSMTVLNRMSEKYPELRNELRILIENQMPYQKPAFTARGSKILAKLKRG